MSGTISKELRPLYRKALDAGWREVKTKKGKMLYPPNGGRPVAFHGSCHGKGAVRRNAEKQLREGGLDV